jgi:AcrR family transcriptional regulator
MQALARDLGVGRTTLYGWFGSRGGLVAEAFAHQARLTLFRIRAQVSTTGALHRTHVAIFEELIAREVHTGAYVAPLPVATLAYALVTLGEHAIFIEAQGLHPDLERLAAVQAHLLGALPP